MTRISPAALFRQTTKATLKTASVRADSCEFIFYNVAPDIIYVIQKNCFSD